MAIIKKPTNNKCSRGLSCWYLIWITWEIFWSHDFGGKKRRVKFAWKELTHISNYEGGQKKRIKWKKKILLDPRFLVEINKTGCILLTILRRNNVTKRTMCNVLFVPFKADWISLRNIWLSSLTETSCPDLS